MEKTDGKYKIGHSDDINGYFERIMAIGPHPDDIELGCAGTISRLKEKGSEVAFVVLTSGGTGGVPEMRKKEAGDSARMLGAKLYMGDFVDTEIVDHNPTIKYIEDCIQDFKPTAIFINSPDDSHQDHRNAANAAISAARFIPVVLFYQTPSSARRFSPKVYFNITDYIDKKVEAVKIHRSQGENVYMAHEAVRGLAEFLGLQVYQNGQLYEGFEIYQMII